MMTRLITAEMREAYYKEHGGRPHMGNFVHRPARAKRTPASAAAAAAAAAEANAVSCEAQEWDEVAQTDEADNPVVAPFDPDDCTAPPSLPPHPAACGSGHGGAESWEDNM